MSSIKNIVVVALMQVIVIVAGVLAAGLCHKECTLSNIAMPLPAAMLYTYGFTAFLVPLAWSAGAVTLQLRPNVSEDVRTLMFWLGVFVLIALAIFCIYADVTLWLRILWNLSSPRDDNGP
jgi:hypothetical protein